MSTLEKIKALLALAGNNPSEEEARSALLKARELAAKHDIDIEGLEEGLEEEPVFIRYDFGNARSCLWKFRICNCLAHPFNVSLVFIGGRERKKGLPSTQNLYILGKQSDIDAAKVVFEFTVGAFDGLFKKSLKKAKENSYLTWAWDKSDSYQYREDYLTGSVS